MNSVEKSISCSDDEHAVGSGCLQLANTYEILRLRKETRVEVEEEAAYGSLPLLDWLLSPQAIRTLSMMFFVKNSAQ